MNETDQRSRNRVRLLARLGFVWAALIVARLVQLQIVNNDQFLAEAKKQQTRDVDVEPPRGAVLDVQGLPLAMSLAVDSVVINPLLLPNVDTAVMFLSRILDLNPAKLCAAILEAKGQKPRPSKSSCLAEPGEPTKKPSQFMWVARKITPEQSARIRSLNLEWIQLRTEYKRLYPNGRLAAQLLGGVHEDGKGYAGVEKGMDSELSSHIGLTRVAVDSKQRGYNMEVAEPASAGESLSTTIDRRIQYVAERAIEKAVKANASNGSIIVMDPKTGQIHAIANYPTYDPNVAPRNDAEVKLRQNLAVEVPFEPGSVFKVVALAAALEAGAVTGDTMLNCGERLFGKMPGEAHGHKLGVMTVREAIARSVNGCAIKMATLAGRDRYYRTVRAFGFGSPTHVELPAETAGVVHPLPVWRQNSIAYVAVGHEMMASTLQLAQFMSTLANGGRLVRPTILKKELSAEAKFLRTGFEPNNAEPQRQVIRPETAMKVLQILESVVLQGGTGTAAKPSGYSAGGKTGSAQMVDPKTGHYLHGRYHASFMGFAPLNNPQLVVVVTLNGANQMAGALAAPVFKEVAEPALRILDIPKDLPEVTPAPKKEIDPAH
ncbi:MAG: penicillin-binding protein 2 [Bryobacteraceae bacterium]|nr:penicillin-binding protein 2 [Bryobacteraceae bacterium]